MPAPGTLGSSDAEIIDTAGYGPYQFKDFCTLFSVKDPNYYSKIAFWKTPLADCGDARGQTCVDYSIWSQKWTEIKG